MVWMGWGAPFFFLGSFFFCHSSFPFLVYMVGLVVGRLGNTFGGWL